MSDFWKTNPSLTRVLRVFVAQPKSDPDFFEHVIFIFLFVIVLMEEIKRQSELHLSQLNEVFIHDISQLIMKYLSPNCIIAHLIQKLSQEEGVGKVVIMWHGTDQHYEVGWEQKRKSPFFYNVRQCGHTVHYAFWDFTTWSSFDILSKGHSQRIECCNTPYSSVLFSPKRCTLSVLKLLGQLLHQLEETQLATFGLDFSDEAGTKNLGSE
jgi:hypothetical protein